MGKLDLQNETSDPTAPATDVVRVYPVDDVLHLQDSAGNISQVVTAGTTYAYIFGDADTDGSVRLENGTGYVKVQKRVSGSWLELQSLDYEE